MIVVPDSITPYIGYKALLIKETGELVSPSYTTAWPVGQRLEATCTHARDWQWIAVEGEAEDSPTTTTLPGIYQTTTYQATPRVQFYPGYPPKPDKLPPPGHHWSFEQVAHQAGEKNCTCGIYVVEDLNGTFSYMRPDAVVCQIALWGQVTVADRGARGQYAYPQKMYVPTHLADVAPLVADLYEIPTERQYFTTGREPRKNPQIRFEDPKLKKQQLQREARAAAYICGAFSLLLSVTTLIVAWSAHPALAVMPGMVLLVAVFLTMAAIVDSRE